MSKDDLVERDYAKQALTVEELETIFGDDEVAPFLNTRHAVYQERGFAESLPSRKELFALIGEEPNLLRRPIIRKGKKLVIGFDLAKLQDL